MAIKLHSYRSRLMEKLTIPSEAKHYINAALKDSPGMFFEAIKDVAQAHQMAAVAKKSGVAREALYRSLSKQGNPSWKTLISVLDVLGLESAGVKEKDAGVVVSITSAVPSIRKTVRLAAKHSKAKRIETGCNIPAGSLQKVGLGMLPNGYTVIRTAPVQLGLGLRYGNAGQPRNTNAISGAAASIPTLPPYLSHLLLTMRTTNGSETNP